MVGSWFSDSLNSGNGGGVVGSSGGAPSQPKGAPGSQWIGAPGSQIYGAPGSQPGPAPSAPAPKSWAGQAIDAGIEAQRARMSAGGGAGVSQYANPYGGIQSMMDTMYGPQQQLLGQQLARQYDSLGMIGEDVQYRQGAATRDTSLAQQLLGLDKQGLGIEKNLTNTQLANLGRLKGILQQQYGLNDRDLATTMKQLGFDESQAKDMAKRKQWDLRSELTARGAFNTIANERGTGRINTDLMFQLLGIGTQKEKAKLGHEGSKLGLDEKGIGYDNTAAGLNAKLQNIGLDYQRLGINSQQLANSLQDSLRQIGLDGYMSVNQILDGIGGTNQQQAQLYGTILNEMLGYSQLPPDVLKQLSGMLGITPKAPTTKNQGPGYEL